VCVCVLAQHDFVTLALHGGRIYDPPSR